MFLTKSVRSASVLLGRRYRSTTGHGKVYASIVDTIGNTPSMKVNNIDVPNDVNMYVKAEFFNPAGKEY